MEKMLCKVVELCPSSKLSKKRLNRARAPTAFGLATQPRRWCSFAPASRISERFCTAGCPKLMVFFDIVGDQLIQQLRHPVVSNRRTTWIMGLPLKPISSPLAPCTFCSLIQSATCTGMVGRECELRVAQIRCRSPKVISSQANRRMLTHLQ